MKIDERKLARQLGIIQDWVIAGAVGTVEAATGFGKSYLAILAIKKMFVKDTNRTAIVVVPTIPLKAQWEEELTKHGIHKNVRVYVINTIALQGLTLETDMLVLDEIHRYASDEFMKLFDLIKYQWILGLTATLNRLDGRHEFLEKKAPIIATVTQEEAKLSGYISQFKEYNLGIELNVKDRATLDHLNQEFHRYFAQFGHDFKLAMSCTTKVGAEAYAQANGLEAKRVAMWANRFNYYMRQRKEFLYKATCKKEVAIQILEKFSLKTVTFSESTDFADALTQHLGQSAVCYHSKLATQVLEQGRVIAIAEKVDKKMLFKLLSDGNYYTYQELKKKHPKCKKRGSKELKRIAIEDFCNGLNAVTIINTAKALDQGFNVEDIELAIITSSTTNPTQHIQRVGRAVRKFIYADGTIKIPIVVNIYIANSQDEKWLKSRQLDPKTGKPLNPDVIWINSIDKIGS